MSLHLCNDCITKKKFEKYIGDAITVSKGKSYSCEGCGTEFRYYCAYCRSNLREAKPFDGIHVRDKHEFCSRECVLNFIDGVSDISLENKINSEG